jgi:hypothetical protein
MAAVVCSAIASSCLCVRASQSFRSGGNGAPALLLGDPIGGDGIEERAPPAPGFLVFPLWIQTPKLSLILLLAQIIDQVVAVVADENLVLFDDLDKRLHPARWRFNR